MDGQVTNSVATTIWLTPKVVVPIILTILASVIIPLLLHWLKGKREKANKIFDVRREAYTQYFKKFESASENVGQDYEEFSRVTLQNEFKKLLESDSSSDAIVQFSKAVGDFPNKIQSSYRKATEEITGLQIIGSSKFLELTREFEQLNREILEQSSDWLEEMKSFLSMPDFESPIAREMKRKGERVRELKEQIIMQMRNELGIDKK